MVNIKNVIELINNNKDWERKILSLIKNRKLDPLLELKEGNNILHLSASNNKINIIYYILNTNPEFLQKMNHNGQTCLHIIASFYFIHTLKICLKKCPEFINLRNNNNETILHILYDDWDFLNWAFTYIKNIDINVVSNKNETILTKNILASQYQNDKYYKNIILILNNKPDLFVPKDMPPLFLAIELKKDYIAKLLIKNNPEIVNIKDQQQLTPLLLAIYYDLYDIIKLLLEKGAIINYSGPKDEYEPFSLLLSRNKFDIIDLLLKYNYDLTQRNRFLDTPLHISFNSHKKIPNYIVAKLIYYGDLNIQNLDGNTPFHLFLKKYNWKYFDKFLEVKKLDIFIRNNDGKRPLDYVKNNQIPIFINMITTSFIHQLKYQTNKQINILLKELKIRQLYDRDNFNSEQFKSIIKKYILTNNKSFPDIDDEYFLEKELNNFIDNIKTHTTNYGKFNSDTIHSVIYLLEILKKYNNVGIPFQFYIDDKVINDKLLFIHTNCYQFPKELIISDVISIYLNFFYELLPYLIIWHNNDLYYINKHLDFYIKKCLIAKKIRYIIMKLTLITSATGMHANIIIFDKNTGILERFDPYGYVSYLDSDKLDDFLKQKFGDILQDFLRNQQLNLIYLSPKDYLGTSSFQILSNESDLKEKKLGDPIGYCLAWTFWYLELRIRNHDVHPKKLISQSIKTIIKKKINFLDLIRHYAFKLDSLKNKFLLKANVNKKYIYNIVFPIKEQKKIINKIIIDFHKIIMKRYDIY